MAATAARPKLIAVEGTVPSREPYPLEAKWEAALVTLACTRPRVYGRIVHLMEADLFNSPEAKLAVGACHEIMREAGHGPDSLLTVLQCLRKKMHSGACTLEEIEAVDAYFEGAIQRGLPNDEDAVQQAIPIVKARAGHAALTAALKSRAKGDAEGLTEAGQALARVEGIGRQDLTLGTRVGSGSSFDQIRALQTMKRLQLGVYDLDERLNGGISNGFSVVFIGGSGDGKSVMLSSALSFNALLGGVYLYATLELPEAIILARIKSYLTGVPINDILAGGAQCSLAQARIAELENAGRLGTILVKEFSPDATTVDDLQQWVAQVEYEHGQAVRVLAIDYQDLLTAPPGTKLAKHERDHVMSMALHVWAMNKAKQSPFWVLTASQGDREAGTKGSQIGMSNVAGGMGKVRNADAVLTLNARDEGRQLEVHVAKDRLGASRYTVGPWPTDFACGRIGPFRDPQDYGDGWGTGVGVPVQTQF